MLLALTLETAKNIAIVVILGLIVIAFLVAKFVNSVAVKAITILVLGGVVLGVWTQRQSLIDCGERGSAEVSIRRFLGHPVLVLRSRGRHQPARRLSSIAGRTRRSANWSGSLAWAPWRQSASVTSVASRTAAAIHSVLAA